MARQVCLGETSWPLQTSGDRSGCWGPLGRSRSSGRSLWGLLPASQTVGIKEYHSKTQQNTVQSFIFVGDQFLLILKRRCSFEFTSPIRNSDLQLHVLFYIKQWKLTPKENVWFLSPNTLWTFIDDLEILLHFDFLGIKSMFREKERGRKSKEDRTQQNALGKQIHIKVRSSHFFP